MRRREKERERVRGKERDMNKKITVKGIKMLNKVFFFKFIFSKLSWLLCYESNIHVKPYYYILAITTLQAIKIAFQKFFISLFLTKYVFLNVNT